MGEIEAKSYSKEQHTMIMQNLAYALDKEKLSSRRKLSDEFKRKGIILSQGVISGCITEKGKGIMSIAVLRDICQFIDVSMDDITRPDYIAKVEAKKNDEDINVHDFLHNLFARKRSFLYDVDENDQEFRGVANTTFHCYFTPTQHKDTKPLSGVMKLSVKNSVCFASFCLNTGKLDERTKKPLMKNYDGILLLSTKVNCYYCILIGDVVGEMCFMSFRYLSLNGSLMDCRIAEVLTTSSGEDRYPTTHRMLISREKIKSSDLSLILPHLKQNSSDVFITEQDLKSLSPKSESDDCVVAEILRNTDAAKMVYILKENHIRSRSEIKGMSDSDILTLITQIRSLSLADRYNKVSRKLDENVRNLLITKGYFTQQSSDE